MPRGQGKKLAARELDKAAGIAGLDVYDPKAGTKLTPLIDWRARQPRKQY
jgi:hypothetical protein